MLQFCTDTFTWGDYIDKVFDKWYCEPNGKLFVADDDGINPNNNHYHSLKSLIQKPNLFTATSTNGRPIALSHAVLCPNKARLWIEGIRVDPNYRRRKVATALIDKMVQFGRRQGVIEASAIISADNRASQSLFYNNGFNKISKWAYYNIHVSNKSNRIDDNTNGRDKTIKKRIASLEDADKVWSYLRGSETYRLSGKRYFNEWRWYPLDYKTIVDFTRHRKILITGIEDSFLLGIAIIKITKYTNEVDVFQIVYLDASSTSALSDLVSYCADMDIGNASIPVNEYQGGKAKGYKIKQLQIISYQSCELSKIMCRFKIKESANFFLFSLDL